MRTLAAVAISDTSDAARRVQDEIYRNMTPARRVELAVEMSEELRTITIAGIRARHPGIDDEQLFHELLVVLHGRLIADQIAGSSR